MQICLKCKFLCGVTSNFSPYAPLNPFTVTLLQQQWSVSLFLLQACSCAELFVAVAAKFIVSQNIFTCTDTNAHTQKNETEKMQMKKIRDKTLLRHNDGNERSELSYVMCYCETVVKVLWNEKTRHNVNNDSGIIQVYTSYSTMLYLQSF